MYVYTVLLNIFKSLLASQRGRKQLFQQSIPQFRV